MGLKFIPSHYFTSLLPVLNFCLVYTSSTLEQVTQVGKAAGRLGTLVYTKEIFTRLIKVTLQVQRWHVFEVTKFVFLCFIFASKIFIKSTITLKNSRNIVTLDIMCA